MFGKHTDTQELSTQSFVVENARPYRRWGAVIALVLVISGLGYLTLRYVVRLYSPAARVAELEAENARLDAELADSRAALEEMRLQRQVEQATRDELQSQLRTLDAETSRLREELNFFKKTKNKPS